MVAERGVGVEFFRESEKFSEARGGRRGLVLIGRSEGRGATGRRGLPASQTRDQSTTSNSRLMTAIASS